GPRHLHARGLDPGGEEELLELAVGHQVLLDLPLLDLEERRLRDVEVARLDDRYHVAEKEGQEQRADVRAVHVGVGHEDDLVVPEPRDGELLGADPAAERRAGGTAVIGGEDPVAAPRLRAGGIAAAPAARLAARASSALRAAAA